MQKKLLLYYYYYYTYLFDTQQSVSGLLDVFVHIGGELPRESVARVSRGWQVGVPSPPGLSQLILPLVDRCTDKHHSQITRHSHFTRRHHSRNNTLIQHRIKCNIVVNSTSGSVAVRCWLGTAISGQGLLGYGGGQSSNLPCDLTIL